MDRSFIAVLSGIFSVIAFTLLAGITSIPLSIAMWLPFIGFILCCIIIGVVGRLRALHLVLFSFIIYLGFMVFLAANATLWTSLIIGPISMGQIQLAWTNFQFFVNTYIPFLSILSDMAVTLRTIIGDSILAIFLEFAVASSFVGFVGLLITGISGYLTRSPSLHVVAAPEPYIETSEPATVPATPPVSATAPVPEVLPPEPYAAPPPSSTPMEAPPQPTPKGGAPSAQAISGLKGKVKKHLKGTGQKAPGGQSRCPHCNATVIRGSRFCNACEKEI